MKSLNSVEMDYRGLWRSSPDIRYCRLEARCSALFYKVSLNIGCGTAVTDRRPILGEVSVGVSVKVTRDMDGVGIVSAVLDENEE